MISNLVCKIFGERYTEWKCVSKEINDMMMQGLGCNLPWVKHVWPNIQGPGCPMTINNVSLVLKHRIHHLLNRFYNGQQIHAWSTCRRNCLQTSYKIDLTLESGTYNEGRSLVQIFFDSEVDLETEAYVFSINNLFSDVGKYFIYKIFLSLLKLLRISILKLK